MRATPEQHHRQIQALLEPPGRAAASADHRLSDPGMVGRQDRWSPLAQHEEIAALIPNAELVVIEESGHMSLVEQPEQVSEALLRWLGFEMTHERRSRREWGVEADGRGRDPDRIPDTPLFDRKRSLRGYRINKMAMGLGTPANREAFRRERERLSRPLRPHAGGEGSGDVAQLARDGAARRQPLLHSQDLGRRSGPHHGDRRASGGHGARRISCAIV